MQDVKKKSVNEGITHFYADPGEKCTTDGCGNDAVIGYGRVRVCDDHTRKADESE